MTDVCFEGNDDNDRSWTSANLKVLCTQLGYPGALMASNITVQNNPSLSDMFTNDYKCGSGKVSTLLVFIFVLFCVCVQFILWCFICFYVVFLLDFKYFSLHLNGFSHNVEAEENYTKV